MSDLKPRQEGVRIKHSVNGNSLKLYDKAFTVAGSVLRAEATLHNGADFRFYRPKEGDPDGEMAWRQMRRGVADLHRRAEVSRKATERYLDAYSGLLLHFVVEPRQQPSEHRRAHEPADRHAGQRRRAAASL